MQAGMASARAGSGWAVEPCFECWLVASEPIIKHSMLLTLVAKRHIYFKRLVRSAQSFTEVVGRIASEQGCLNAPWNCELARMERLALGPPRLQRAHA